MKAFCDNYFSIVSFVVLLCLSASAACILVYCFSECGLAQHVLIKGLVMLRVVCEDEKENMALCVRPIFPCQFHPCYTA